jgi:DNA-binding HxlR family transcriptional regulator
MKGTKNRLVDTSIHILRLLSKGQTNVNEIIRQTSSDRTYIITLIKTLQREKLIERVQTPAKQVKILSLSNLGRELVDLLDNIIQYNKSYSELRKTTKESLDIIYSDENDLKSKLTSKGWNEQDIDHYTYYLTNSASLQYECHSKFINVLGIRYGTIISEFKPGKTARIILDEIMSEAFSGQFSLMLEYLFDSNNPYFPAIKKLFASLEDLLEYSNKFIDRETKNIVKSLFSLLDPPNKHIVNELETLKGTLRLLEKKNYDSTEEELKAAADRIRRLSGQGSNQALQEKMKKHITFLEEYLAK